MPDSNALTPQLVIFDDGLGTFGPLVDVRAAFELRCGLGTMRERIERAVGVDACRLLTTPALAFLTAETTSRATSGGALSGEIIAVNGRLLTLDAIKNLSAGEVRVTAADEIVAARVDGAVLAHTDVLAAIRAAARSSTVVVATHASAPWDITARIGATLAEDLELFRNSATLATVDRRVLRPDEGQAFGKHAIHIDRSASLGPYCVIDASKGPVIVGAHVTVRPFAVLIGPCAILEGSTVSERALMKASTVIGPHCRVGGEIGGTIFQSFSNKSHDGHLGDSFVGEWVNIGAGSDNSNLLNTYSEVIVRLDTSSGLTRTGTQFWGSIIGDHAKLAIGTRLMTGTTIGTGAMIAQSRPPASLVTRFAWLVDGAEGAKFFRFDKFMDTARAMMLRRKQQPSAALEAVLRALHTRATGG